MNRLSVACCILVVILLSVVCGVAEKEKILVYAQVMNFAPEQHPEWINDTDDPDRIIYAGCLNYPLALLLDLPDQYDGQAELYFKGISFLLDSIPEERVVRVHDVENLEVAGDINYGDVIEFTDKSILMTVKENSEDGFAQDMFRIELSNDTIFANDLNKESSCAVMYRYVDNVPVAIFIINAYG